MTTIRLVRKCLRCGDEFEVTLTHSRVKMCADCCASLSDAYRALKHRSEEYGRKRGGPKESTRDVEAMRGIDDYPHGQEFEP